MTYSERLGNYLWQTKRKNPTARQRRRLEHKLGRDAARMDLPISHVRDLTAIRHH